MSATTAPSTTVRLAEQRFDAAVDGSACEYGVMKARRHGQTRERHTGYTLIELVFVVAILGIATIAGIRGLEGYLDAIAVRNAVADVGALMARARDEAITRRTVVTLHIDT